jgi:hypothetical protein
MTSWLLRTAVAHGCSWNDMTELLRKAGIGDPDFLWPWDLRSSAAFFAADLDDFRPMLSWVDSYIGRARAFDVLRGSARRPVFGLCSHCIRDVRVTHYSVESRFCFVTLCALHGTPLRAMNHHALLAGLSDPLPLGAFWNGGSPDAARGPAHRLALERRVRAVVRLGFERHPVLGVVPAQSVLRAEAWRLTSRRCSADAGASDRDAALTEAR